MWIVFELLTKNWILFARLDNDAGKLLETVDQIVPHPDGLVVLLVAVVGAEGLNNAADAVDLAADTPLRD